MSESHTKAFISRNNPIFFIAEVGGNHEGDFTYAKKLTRLAIDSGADAVKFQFYSGDTLVSPLESADRNAHFKRFELSKAQNMSLMKLVKNNNSLPMASVWSEQMLSWANDELSLHKVGSGDLTCYPMLSLLARTGKPIILSTGLSSLAEVEHAVRYIEECDPNYIAERKLALLQCTSSYPTPDEDANLSAMMTLKNEFGLPIGYSDHTLGSDAIEAAVAIGAEIIEKHFTDTRNGKTFRDHLIALTKDEVQKTLTKMRRINAFMGDGNKALTKSESEAGHHVSFRRSIYASRFIAAGEELTQDNLTVLRPLAGVCASKFDAIVGRVAKRDLLRNEALRDEDFV